jgi:phosphoenolpyruvate-protein phosphotransferase
MIVMASSITSDRTIELVAPLSGWTLPLAEVPDPVFAGGLAGDGVAIDPTSESLHAPCDGVVALMAGGRHALTLKTLAGDVLMHVGIDTVKLAGAGFGLLVRDGEAVRTGQRLLDFDLDAIVRRAPSAVTPVLLTDRGAGRIVRRQTGSRVEVGDFLFAVEVSVEVAAAAIGHSGAPLSRHFRIPFEHGLHARPAARVVTSLASFEADVVLHARGRSGNARSTVALMALGVTRGEIIAADATGRDAGEALAALARLLELVQGPARPAQLPRIRPAPSTPAAQLSAPADGTRLAGVVAARGLAVGTAVPLHVADIPVEDARGDPAAERDRLLAAIEAVAGHLQGLAAPGEGARRGVLDAHLALLGDPQLLRRAEALLATRKSAGMAWRVALREAADALAELDDPRMAERRADLLDIERQVLRVLAGAPAGVETELPEQAIVLAAELLPSQLLTLNAARLAGICMAGSGPTSHVAILAGSMGLPTLVAAGATVLAIAPGTPLVLDAETGFLLVDPPMLERARIAAQVEARVRARAADAAAAHLPATTLDGTSIHVYCNLGAAAEAEPAVRAGAEGCGLLRTEFLFLDRERAPDAAEQLSEYQAIARSLGGRPLTIRTLDAGGDKPIAYLPMPREDNPALGLRGLRMSLARPELLAAQLSAIARVEPVGQCRVLLPMVTDLDDVRTVREQLVVAARELGRAPPSFGVMIETPASALLADQLAAEVDFLSIGSNDLAQYTLAMDRLHPMLAPRLDGLHPAVLQLIDRTARACRERAREVGVCGGLASDPEAVPLLIGFGVRELSVVPAMIPRIKGLVRTLTLGDCGRLAREALELENAAAVRACVRAWLHNRAGAPGSE